MLIPGHVVATILRYVMTFRRVGNIKYHFAREYDKQSVVVYVNNIGVNATTTKRHEVDIVSKCLLADTISSSSLA